MQKTKKTNPPNINKSKTIEEALSKTAFVIMPIGKKGTDDYQHFHAVYEKFVKPALVGYGFQALRADELAQSGSITKDIIKYLVSCELVIADLTDLNPNVFYELGIRHALKECGTILLIDEAKTPSIPFDLSPYRTITFRGSSAEGLGKLSDELKRFMDETRKAKHPNIDNPVHDWITFLERHNTTNNYSPDKKHNWRKTTSVSVLSISYNEISDPRSTITEALEEVEKGLLPQDIINDAQVAVSNQNMQHFLECVQKFLDIKALQPSESQFGEMYFLAERMAVYQVSRALVNIGSQIFPDSKRIFGLHVRNLSASPKQTDRNQAQEIIKTLINLERDTVQTEQLRAVGRYIDLLALYLDIFYRDGNDVTALEIILELVLSNPDDSTILKNYAHALDKNRFASSEEVFEAYKASIMCTHPHYQSALWFANYLEGCGRLVDATELLLFACMTDLDEAESFARVANILTDILQPRNLLKLRSAKRSLPSNCNESHVTQSILLSMSCPSFGVEHKFTCERAMRNIGISDKEIQDEIDEVGELTRRDRREFVMDLYEQLKSPITSKEIN